LGANLPGVLIVLLVFAWVARRLVFSLVRSSMRRYRGQWDMRSLKSAHGRIGRMLVAVGNRTADAQDNCAVPSIRLGDAGAASTDQLRNGLDAAFVPILVLVGFGAVANMLRRNVLGVESASIRNVNHWCASRAVSASASPSGSWLDDTC